MIRKNNVNKIDHALTSTIKSRRLFLIQVNTVKGQTLY